MINVLSVAFCIGGGIVCGIAYARLFFQSSLTLVKQPAQEAVSARNSIIKSLRYGVYLYTVNFIK